ncbi:cysteine-rich and transmembrane domain-containing protein WIH1 [Morus notabilis]|uniref:cysteine-rich and transmembrane domain-containing protein WIH1 n=1 Tax=Morus notabilis TaxID=981085 RepID=UPI000CED40CD|nr:cysteine-rich and transmembrane domain-containing protein WIH1 [Morus notabilis]
MSHQQAPVVYPRPAAEYSMPPIPPSYPPAAPAQPVVTGYEGHNNNNYQVPYVAAPPPAGYPTTNYYGRDQTNHVVPAQTNSKGEGFWKGCVAALCCCWVLDVCCC